jgi:AmmeMemoRadiSam system protein B
MEINQNPIVRYLDIKQISNDLFYVSDPFSIAEDFVINKIGLLIIFLLDGTKNTEEVREQVIKNTGIFITKEEFNQVINYFYENNLFYNDNILELRKKKGEEISKKGIIDFYLKDLYSKIDEFIDNFGLKELENNKESKYESLIVPHIDIRVGRSVYIKSYSSIRKDYKRIFIFGVSHYFHNGLFSVCPLDFNTPLGTVYTDKEAIAQIAKEFNLDPVDEILSYTKEHSIHLHLPYIKYLFPNAKIIAMIISYKEENIKEDLTNLASFISKNYGDSLFISSIDLSHVGNKFGDSSLFDPEDIDKQYINYLLNIDTEKAFDLINSKLNYTRIDGIFTNYLFLKILKLLNFKKGELIDYQKYKEKETNSMVTFSSIGFIKSL